MVLKKSFEFSWHGKPNHVTSFHILICRYELLIIEAIIQIQKWMNEAAVQLLSWKFVGSLLLGLVTNNYQCYLAKKVLKIACGKNSRTGPT